MKISVFLRQIFSGNFHNLLLLMCNVSKYVVGDSRLSVINRKITCATSSVKDNSYPSFSKKKYNISHLLQKCYMSF